MAITFPATLDSFSDKTDNVDDVMAVDMNDVQDAVEALEVKVGIDSSAVTGSLDYKVNKFFATGRKVWIYENTAPTGWSIYATVEDCVIAVKGGSQAYNVTGGDGAEKGTWTQPSHTLITDEIPAHVHSIDVGKSYLDGAYVIGGGRHDLGTQSRDTDSTGGGGAHSHGTTYRPLAAVGIIIQKT